MAIGALKPCFFGGNFRCLYLLIVRMILGGCSWTASNDVHEFSVNILHVTADDSRLPIIDAINTNILNF